MFLSLHPCTVHIRCANGEIMTCYWSGTLVVNHNSQRIVIPNSLFIPNVITLISASQIVNMEKSLILLASTGLEIYRNRNDLKSGKILFKTPKRLEDKLWEIKVDPPQRQSKNLNTETVSFMKKVFKTLDIELLHRRYCHVSEAHLKKRFKSLKNQKLEVCSACMSQRKRLQYCKRYVQTSTH